RHGQGRAHAQWRVEHADPPPRRGGPAGAGPPRRHPRVDSRRPRNGGPALSVRARGGAGRRNRRRSAAAARRRRPRAPAARHVGRIRLRAPGAHANALAVCISITRARNGGTSADRKEAAGRSVSEGWEGAGRAPRGRRKPSTWWGCSGSSPPRDWRVTVKILLVIFAPDFRRSEAAGGWPGVRAPPLTLPRSRTSLPGCHCRVSALAVTASHAGAPAGLWSRGSLHQAAGNASLTGNRPRKLRSVDDAGLESRRRSVEPRGEVMRKLLLGMAAMLVALSAAALAIASSSGDDSLLPKEQRYVSDSQTSSKNGTKSGSSLNMAVVGTNTLGDRGFNGDVCTFKGYAYIGRWGFFDPQHRQFCPAGGVAVIDARTPSFPQVVGNLEVPGASHEDVVVYTEKYGPLTGHDIAAVGLQYCASSRLDPAAAGKRGLGLWDVTNPATPKLLSVFGTGCCTRGFHELEVGDRADLAKTFVYASLPYAERADSSSPNGMRDRAGRGEAWIVDVTDPWSPSLVSTFGIKKDLGLNPAAGQGCFAISFGHGMNPSGDGEKLFVSYWD